MNSLRVFALTYECGCDNKYLISILPHISVPVSHDSDKANIFARTIMLITIFISSQLLQVSMEA